MFFIAASVYAFGTVFYGLFGSGEIQPWASPEIVVAGVEPTVNEISVTLQEDDGYPAESTCNNSDSCTHL